MDLSKILFLEIPFKPSKSATNVKAASATTTTGGQSAEAKATTTTTPVSSNNFNNNNNHNHNHKIHTNGNGHASAAATNGTGGDHLEEFQTPRHQLCDPNIVQLDWIQTEKVGGGLVNVGNTCFLNSVLQCLTYCPPLYNFLVKFNGGHSSTCKISQFCMLCEMEKHVKRIKSSNGGSIKPMSIVQRLKYINKSFQYGRQEDAHELLRYILDHMWKACLTNHDISLKSNKLDPKIKETTVINHIFGGYHRSQVLCLTCNSRSNTYDFFMDFILDIRNAKSLEEALKKFTQPETLENENAYRCGQCRKKVVARKKFTVYKAPNVATFQFKRFDSDRIFGGKVTKFISYPEELDLRPYMSDPNKTSIKYQLSAVLVHVGHSSNSGHYYCFVKNSNNFWYRMDDSSVSIATQNTVLSQQAYVLFYNRKTSDLKNARVSLVKQDTNQQQQLAQSQTANQTQQQQPPISNQQNNNNSFNGYNIKKISDPKTPSKIDKIDILAHALLGTYSNTTTTTTSTTTTSNNSNTNNTSTSTTAITTLATWQGTRSMLDEVDSNKRKLNDLSERDKFNDELDQGKIKKVKARSRDDRFANLVNANPFQRFSSNGYLQYNNNNKFHKREEFKNHHGRQYNNNNNHNNSHNSHKNKFRHNGKHKGRNFNRRQ